MIEFHIERNEPGRSDSGGRLVLKFCNDDELMRMLAKLGGPRRPSALGVWHVDFFERLPWDDAQ